MPRVDLDDFGPGGIADVFMALEELDKEEGRGGRRLIGYFLNMDDAVVSAKGMGIQGSNGVITKRMIICDHHGKWYELGDRAVPLYTEAQPDLRRSALAKLTPEERSALGIKES